MLRFIICGSADHKAALMGCLLRQAKRPAEDATSAEDEHDDARSTYHCFSTAERKFIVAEPTSDEQYTRNIVVCAAVADLAVLLVDARSGLLNPTRHHAFLASLLGVRHVVLALDNIDLVGFNAGIYQAVEAAFRAFAKTLGFESITTIPLSAEEGDNVVEHSARTPWYEGPTLMGYLETVQIESLYTGRLVFPVQEVDRTGANLPSFGGTVAEGQVKVGDEVRVTASGEKAFVTDIAASQGALETASFGDSVTLKLDRDIGACRGDIMSLSRHPLEMTDQFEATVIWMGESAGLTGRNYDLKLAGQCVAAFVTNIKYRINVNTLAHEACTQLQSNDIAVCNIATAKPLVLDCYNACATLGGFTLIDRFTHATVGAGTVIHSLRRAQNVHWQALSVTRTDRERLNGHRGKVIWFTGLSGSGKSTLANALEVELNARGSRTYILDGDNIRQGLNKGLGFTDADRVENIRRVAEVAKLMSDAGLIVMTAFISPFKREREMARELIGKDNFVEVYVSTPLEICEQRDVKGLYKKARAGSIPNMTGINSPYEPPEAPDYIAGADRTAVEVIVRDLAAELL